MKKSPIKKKGTMGSSPSAVKKRMNDVKKGKRKILNLKPTL